MKALKFFRPYRVWLPTWQGLVVIGLTLLACGWLVLNNMALFLSKQAPVEADYLVVDGWLSKTELEQALEEFESNGYHQLITTGGPDTRGFSPFDSYAEHAAAIFIGYGLPASKIIVLPTPASAQNRSYLSAVIVRKWSERQGSFPFAMNVFTANVHARRSHALYQLAFRKLSVDIGVIAAEPEQFTLERWWQSSEGAKSVIAEFAGWFWTQCCFKPGDVDTHEEMWG